MYLDLDFEKYKVAFPTGRTREASQDLKKTTQLLMNTLTEEGRGFRRKRNTQNTRKKDKKLQQQPADVRSACLTKKKPD